MGTAELLFLIAVPIVIYSVMYSRNRKKVRGQRAAMFDNCLDLFETYRVTQNDVYYPVLTGLYQKNEIKIEPIADDIAFRTLPSLWILITVRGAIPYKGIFDFLVRPRDNTQTYSPSADLNSHLRIPEGWPSHALLRTNDRLNMPPENLITPHMGLFDDSRSKELSIGPGGIRFVYLLCSAEIPYYKLFRQVRFNDITVDPDLLKNLLEKLLILFEDLKNNTHGKEKAKETEER